MVFLLYSILLSSGYVLLIGLHLIYVLVLMFGYTWPRPIAIGIVDCFERNHALAH